MIASAALTALCALMLVPAELQEVELGGDHHALHGFQQCWESPSPLWKPVADTPFLQETCRQYPTGQPLDSVAAVGDAVYAVSGGTVLALKDGQLSPMPGAPEKVSRLFSLYDTLWAAAEGGLYLTEAGAWRQIDKRHYADLIMHNNLLYGAAEDNLYRPDAGGGMVCVEPEGGYRSTESTFIMEDGTQILPEPVTFDGLRRITGYSGTIYALQEDSVVLFDGQAIVTGVADWGELPSTGLNDMLAMGSRLFVATDQGLAVLRGMAWTMINGDDGLPVDQTTCLARGFDGDLWIGTARGAVRMTGDQFHYFGRNLWLPGDRVNAIAVNDKTVCVATDGGLSVITYTPMTLAKKAEWFERRLAEGGHKRLGFVHDLTREHKTTGDWVREISDNDGGHTVKYLAAMSFKYAATGDEAARAEAVDTFKTIAWLEEITGVPGLPARCIWAKGADRGEQERLGSGGLPARWYTTPDGLWEWKGDTSSDEIAAHFYGVTVFHQLAARGAEKDRAAEHLRRIADHIIGNGWKLRDANGQPTRWGRWDPDYLLKPYGFYGRGLNGLQAQNFVITARAVTGDAKYDKALDQLKEWGYHRHTVRQRITFPPEEIAPWDDRLSFESFYPLLLNTTDPVLRGIYLRSLERTWEIKRMEQVPWYNFIYGAITGNDCEAPQAADHLRAWTLNLQNLPYTNSHRGDLAPQRGYVPYGIGTRAMSPRETEAKRGNRTALPHDNNPRRPTITEPTGWLEDYWMGRYFGFIHAPGPNALPAEFALPEDTNPKAAPYEGPARPEITMGG